MRWEVYEIAIRVIRKVKPLIEKIEIRDRNLADQIREAATSTPMNLREGNRRSGRDRVYRFRIAAGSADEVWGGLDCAVAWGYIEATGAADVITDLNSVLAIIRSMIR